MENLDSSINELINVITNSKEYKIVVELKEKMNTNDELMKLIRDVKILQKKYIKSNYDVAIKQELEDKKSKLNEIPIYFIYTENLRIVNEMISVITDELNTYFSNKLNPED